jgi:hypothetical protein
MQQGLPPPPGSQTARQGGINPSAIPAFVKKKATGVHFGLRLLLQRRDVARENVPPKEDFAHTITTKNGRTPRFG